MTPSDAEYHKVWTRFEALAVLSESKRKQSFDSDGMAFIERLVRITTTGYPTPDIRDAEEFSTYIVEMRANYRLWNQHLMSLMFALDDGDMDQRSTSLQEFCDACLWIILVEAAQNC